MASLIADSFLQPLNLFTGKTTNIYRKMSLDPRAENVLKNLVETYIQDGQPVGSRTLSKLPQLGVSSATVRNVMSDLEELGLITSPHTSAGRIPTSQGYRVFVDKMVKASTVTQSAIEQLSERFENETDPEALLSHASDVLSELTQFAGVVVLPHQSVTRFHQLEFMRLSEARVLAILVTEDGRVQNRVLTTAGGFSDSELVEAANFFNQRYKGNTLDDVRRLLVEDMQHDNDEMHQVNQTAIQAASQVISEEDAANTKDLDRSMKADGISVFIGEESGYTALGECSVIASPYESEGKVLGTLGVVGPTRMAYSDVISVVDITAKLLSQALTTNRG